LYRNTNALNREGSGKGVAYVLEFESTALPEVRIVKTKMFSDERGYFSEVYNRVAFAAGGIRLEFVQDNVSLSLKTGTVRGLHFQTPPFAQAKLIRAVRGSILDVVVDIRRSSPTFGQHVRVELSGGDCRQLFVPAGYAHGFCTLEPDTEVQYKVSAPYSADHDRGLAWNDPALSIEWPVDPAQAVLSDKDRRNPPLAELPAFFQE
jgi:dTDP-4-dehydrorhamnose 3,5-epimerase